MNSKKKAILRLLCCLVCCVSILMLGRQAEAATLKNVMNAPKASAGKLLKEEKGVRYRFTKSGNYAKSRWLKISGKIYYFKKDGYAQTGWKTYNKKKYYFSSEGKLQTGWKTIGGKKYYFWKSKQELSGSAATGLAKISSASYYFSSNGVMQTGWKKIGKYYYYFRPSTGKMAKSTTVDGYKIDKNGHRTGKASSNTSTDTTKGNSSVQIWVGDSRTVGLGSVKGISSKCIAKVGAGYSWYVSTAEPQLKQKLKKNPEATVILNFGVNDIGNASKYVTKYKALVKKYPKAHFYFMSVNPIDSKYTAGYVSNSMIQSFNKKLKKAFPASYIDTYSYLKKNGFSTVDGLHYTSATYKKIYTYVQNFIKKNQ